MTKSSTLVEPKALKVAKSQSLRVTKSKGPKVARLQSLSRLYVIHDRYARFPDLVSKPEVFRTWRAWPEISVYFLDKNSRLLPNPQVFKASCLLHLFGPLRLFDPVTLRLSDSSPYDFLTLRLFDF